MPSFKVGVQLQPQHTSVAEMRAAWQAADAMGVNSIWTWDHFYPKADTPGCTTQACSVRDAAPELPEDLVVVGVSPDAPSKQAKFAAKYELGFPLLSDTDHAVADMYGAWGERSMYGRKFMGMIRSAALVGPDGNVVAHWPKISPKDTVPKALAAVLANKINNVANVANGDTN